MPMEGDPPKKQGNFNRKGRSLLGKKKKITTGTKYGKNREEYAL